jgi:hypothetical protein
MADAHERMMAQMQRASEIEERLPLNGARVAQHRGLKMEAQGPQDASSRSDQLLSVHLRLLSRITNGVLR